MWAAALGLAPSKDVFWSNSTESYCAGKLGLDCHASRYSHAKEPFPAVQAAVALLSAGALDRSLSGAASWDHQPASCPYISCVQPPPPSNWRPNDCAAPPGNVRTKFIAGPVGPGDKIGAANKTLLLSTCRADGLLLKPGYPAISSDSILTKRSRGGLDRHTGELNVAYSVISNVSFATIIAIDLPHDITLTAAELGFPAGAELAIHSGGGGDSVSVGSSVVVRACKKADFRLIHVSELGHGGKYATLLGEAGKVCPHSPMRFGDIDRLGNGELVVDVAGSSGESVELRFLAADGKKVLRTTCVFEKGACGTDEHLEARVSAQGEASCQERRQRH
eukprot:SAG22_NODE_30_length_28348_cov_12.488584_8_plen_335_part_00